MKVHGADISHHQASVDLAKAKKAGLQFLYHKCTEGVGYVDPTFASRRAAAKKAGLPFGAYHFARPEVGGAKHEAQAFIKHAEPKVGDLRPALDLEVNPGMSTKQLDTWASEFIAEVKRIAGVEPVIYSPFLLDAFKGKTMWVPRYNNTNTPPTQRWDIWQFSNGVFGSPNSFPGLGSVDLNTFHDGTELADILIKPKAEPKPTPKKESRILHLQHSSMEKEDRVAQKREDADVVFALGSDVVTFTEVGVKENRAGHRLLVDAAKRNGFHLFLDPSDCGVAVKVQPGRKLIDEGYELVLKGVAHDHPNVGVAWVTVQDPQLGRMTFGVMHWITGGRKNAELSKAAGDFLAEKAGGKAIAFLAGDVNLDDANHAVVSAGWTSCWDELKTYPNTLANATFDMIASYDKDKRVHCVGGRTTKINSNHRTILVAYSVRGV